MHIHSEPRSHSVQLPNSEGSHASPWYDTVQQFKISPMKSTSNVWYRVQDDVATCLDHRLRTIGEVETKESEEMMGEVSLFHKPIRFVWSTSVSARSHWPDLPSQKLMNSLQSCSPFHDSRISAMCCRSEWHPATPDAYRRNLQRRFLCSHRETRLSLTSWSFRFPQEFITYVQHVPLEGIESFLEKASEFFVPADQRSALAWIQVSLGFPSQSGRRVSRGVQELPPA